MFVLNFILSTVIISILSYYIAYFFMILGDEQKLGHFKLGSTLGTLAFTYPYISYNVVVSLRSRNIDHMLTFLQYGIYKIGFIFGIGFLAGTFTSGLILLEKSIYVVSYVFLGMAVLECLLIRMQVSRVVQIVYYVIGLVVFLVLSLIWFIFE